MQHFNRTDVQAPECLADERSARARAALLGIFSMDKAKLEQERVRMAPFAVEGSELVNALRELFRHRCAFCETKDEIAPYRFRPSEEAGPSSNVAPEFARLSHLYYTWLVNDWGNIYAICDGCQPLEPSVFPMRTGQRMSLPQLAQVERYARGSSGLWPFPGSERQVFLDPCGDENFRLNLAVAPDGRMIGLSERADATIRHFRLDRDELAEGRGRTFERYFGELFQMAEGGYPSAGPFKFADMEHGGSWYLLLYQLARRIGSGSSPAPRLSRNTIRDYYAQRIGAANFRKQLEEAIQYLNENLHTLRRPPRRRRVILRGKARPVAFEIKNFKSIDHLRLELLPLYRDGSAHKVGVALATDELARRGGTDQAAPALMILGENAVGKSSILEAIAYLLAGDAARADLRLPSGSLMLDPDLLGGEGSLRPAKLMAEFEDSSSVQLDIRLGGISGDQGDDEARTPVFAYGAFRIFSEDSVGQRAGSSVISIFRPEYVLPNPERWLVSISEKPLFAEVRRALNQILAIDDEFDGLTVNDGKCFLVTSGMGVDGDRVKTRTPLNLVSSGFRSILSMACHVLRGLVEIQDASSASLANARAVVLIDEVEAHLHPRWKMRVVHGLREALPGVTFIMTTHDPLCLRGLSTSELVVLRRALKRDEELPSTVEQLEELPPVSALTVEQLLTSDFFDLFSTDENGTEITLARAGDLLASESEDKEGVTARADLRRSIADQVARALPIGSTEIERLVQEAVEDFLKIRTTTAAAERPKLRERTRARIVRYLGRY